MVKSAPASRWRPIESAPMTSDPSAEALEAAVDILWPLYTDYEVPKMEFARKSHECRRIALALDRFRATERERPASKITEGLRGAIHTTKLAGEIIDLLPPGVASRDLFHQIIAILTPHIEPPHDR